MAEPRRAWDRARDRVWKALQQLREPTARSTTPAQAELELALEDLAGTEQAAGPVYVLVHDPYDAKIRGVFTTRTLRWPRYRRRTGSI
ncbi:MAG: hypothetical protein M3406_09075 [Chloroflexota bacterium]|nr:hypothetical protein [Chloroflexota bacterium]